MIDIRKLKELVRLMVANELTELDLRDTEEQVTLRRYTSPGNSPAAPPDSPVARNGKTQPLDASPLTHSEQTAVDEDENLIHVQSPMVGTFFSAPNPDAPPFVSVGSTVGPDSVVCIIEAMKIFNEIKAECAGTIQKILVKNGDAVEFGQPLLLVKPA